MSDYSSNTTEPTADQMQDFRNYAAAALQISPESATENISYNKEGNFFKPVFKDPLRKVINPEQLEDLELYFENL